MGNPLTAPAAGRSAFASTAGRAAGAAAPERWISALASGRMAISCQGPWMSKESAEDHVAIRNRLVALNGSAGGEAPVGG